MRRSEIGERWLASQLAASAPAEAPPTRQAPTPVETASANDLRPDRLADMIGQEDARHMFERVIAASIAIPQPLDHVLLVGPSGCGKTTFAHAIANELDVSLYQVEAPISHETLLDLREVMYDGDVLFIDEIHQQAIMERRGRSTSTQPEVLFNVMEDRTLVSGSGVLPFPRITLIGGTTDEGMLPDAFINRFPLRPYLAPYTLDELRAIARDNARELGLVIQPDSEVMFARACRGVPRQVNIYMRNALLLASPGDYVSADVAEEVLSVLNRVSEDGLTMDMQNALTFLYTRARRESKDGDVKYQASVSTIATAIGKSRDTKAVQLRVEPYLIEQGYLQVGHGGRTLTDTGIQRAKELLT
jgi:Holliday junction DNA helicase RuvB